jgi:hypothetical protein
MQAFNNPAHVHTFTHATQNDMPGSTGEIYADYWAGGPAVHSREKVPCRSLCCVVQPTAAALLLVCRTTPCLSTSMSLAEFLEQHPSTLHTELHKQSLSGNE